MCNYMVKDFGIHSNIYPLMLASRGRLVLGNHLVCVLPGATTTRDFGLLHGLAI